MANPEVTREDIESWPKAPYDQLRPSLQSGDLFLASGDYVPSQLIRKLTDSPWSHSGIIFRVEGLDRVLLLEAVEDAGVRLAPLSKYLKSYMGGTPYKGVAVIARRSGLTASQVVALAKFGLDALTRPYDYEEMVKILGRIMLGHGKPDDDTAYICSELVQACYQAAGWPFAYAPQGFIAPRDIWIDSAVELVARIL